MGFFRCGRGHLVSWQGTSGQLVRDIWSVGETDDVHDAAAEARRRRALHKKCSKKQIVWQYAINDQYTKTQP